jgi:hypothetical protein
MFDHRIPGFVAVGISTEPGGDFRDISFFREGAGFGLLANATIYPKPPPYTGEGVEHVTTSAIASRIIELTGDRAGLSAVADFRRLHLGEDGVPLVWEQTLLCKSCNHGWAEELSRGRDIFTCPKCRSAVEPLRAALLWQGPSLPILIEVWNALPEPDARRFLLPWGMRVFETVSGFILVHAAGHRITVTSGRESFTTLFSRRGHNSELAVRVSAEDISAEAPSVQVPH